MSDQPPLSRYERVKQILSDAQGSTIPDYQSYKAFWLLPRAEFLQVEIYGQRMIAPDTGDHTVSDSGAHTAHDHSGHDHMAHAAHDHCEHCDPAPPTSSARPQGYADQIGAGTVTVMDTPIGKRSERSALIIGLRGQFPFDGTQFPPLLWQAAHSVSTSDIAFIAQWIDDGCPETEDAAVVSAASVQQKLLALARGDLPHRLSTAHPSEDRDSVSGLRVRKEVTALTALELEALRDAIQNMYKYDPYWQDERSFGYWARIHADACKHGSELFLPWHRVYLYFFEQQLQDYNANIMLPYWDWAAYADQNQPPQKLTLDAGVIPDAYQCWLNDAGLTALKQTGLFNEAEIAGLEEIENTPYNSGRRLMVAALGSIWQITASPTWKIDHRPQVEAIQTTLRDVNPLWHAIRWPGLVGGGKVTSYPAEATIDKILQTIPFAYFGGGPEDDHHFGVLEEAHNGMHNFSGGANPDFPTQGGNSQDPYNPQFGDMTDNRTTAYDPIFWAHHANVDRLWAALAGCPRQTGSRGTGRYSRSLVDDCGRCAQRQAARLRIYEGHVFLPHPVRYSFVDALSGRKNHYASRRAGKSPAGRNPFAPCTKSAL